MNEKVKKYMPEYVCLYYVDYNSNLNNETKTLQSCLTQNSLFPLSESVFDWWDYPEEHYLDEIKEKMRKDGVEHLFDEHLDDIRDWLYDNDKSTPVEDLLRNTGRISCFYDLGVELDCGWHEAFMCTPWRNESIASCAYKVRRKLGIKKGTPEAEQIYNILCNASCGGSLRIYFNGDIESLISGDEYQSADNKQDFQQIRFKGRVALAVYDPTNGAGDFEYMNIDCVFPFLRDNLSVSDTDKYSLEQCFGMCGDWLDKCVKPELSVEPLKKKRTMKKSPAAELRKREAELDAVFKAGGCTFGDMDMSRHRDVYYDNNIPCGHHCPHCGTFWID